MTKDERLEKFKKEHPDFDFGLGKMKAYRLKNKDKINAYMKAYYLKNKDKIKAYMKAYQKTDKYKAYQKTDKRKAYMKAYRLKHKK